MREPFGERATKFVRLWSLMLNPEINVVDFVERCCRFYRLQKNGSKGKSKVKIFALRLLLKKIEKRS